MGAAGHRCGLARQALEASGVRWGVGEGRVGVVVVAAAVMVGVVVVVRGGGWAKGRWQRSLGQAVGRSRARWGCKGVRISGGVAVVAYE